MSAFATSDPRARPGRILLYAWPTILSCLCNSAFRINDQYWVGPLGRDAQAALGAATFVMVLNYALYFLAVAGSMSRVAQAAGSQDQAASARAVVHGGSLSAIVGILVGLVGYAATPAMVRLLGLEGGVAQAAEDYIRAAYWMALPIALAPWLDNVFISLGDTRTPLILQGCAIGLNFVLNPILIYGGWPAWTEPGAVWLGVEGAAYATGISRAIVVGAGLVWLVRRQGLPWHAAGGSFLRRLGRAWLGIARTGAPSCLSIAIYAGVYLGLTERVFRHLPDAALAGFGIGFNAFEAVAYPAFLGLSLAGASMVGRALGAGDRDLALALVRMVRRLALGLGLLAGVAFVGLGPWLVPAFTQDVGVQQEALLYLSILALSQVFVALETASENVLVASGYTRPIVWISVPGNLARIPLGVGFALTAGMGPAGLWWAINLTTVAKALAMHTLVLRGRWLQAADRPGAGAERSGNPSGPGPES